MQTEAGNTRSEAGKGILLMCIGIALLTVNDALAKNLTSGYSVFQILFIRNMIALPFALLIAFGLGGKAALISHRPSAHLLRGLLWLGAAFQFITSLRYLGLAEATTLVFIAPAIITAISALFLGEQVGWRRWSAVIAGFVGVLIAVQPGSATFQLASLLSLGTAFFYAFLMVGARFVDPRDSVWTLMLYLVMFGALFSGIVSAFVWQPVASSDLPFFAALALTGTIGTTLVTQAFRFAPSAIIAPFDYTALLWATLLGWLFWGEQPGFAVLVGAAIIMASGLYIVWREHRHNKQPLSETSLADRM
ncbi:DMT family transporter [Agrobacterium sp. ES01]|uniref:DMT family transporter n=1 Tax=Agrobacterium sp. ES01 TaxID=3420714 RepID=UPI003D0D5FB6